MDQAKLRSELSRDEGRKPTAYRDGNGHWTIGVGHLIDLDPDRKITVPRIQRITDAECDALLDADIAVAVGSLIVVFGSTKYMPLDDVRQRALVNMAFNRGEKHMRESTTITPAIKNALVALGIDSAGRWKAVAVAIKASPWAKQIGARADRLATMLEKGTV